MVLYFSLVHSTKTFSLENVSKTTETAKLFRVPDKICENPNKLNIIVTFSFIDANCVYLSTFQKIFCLPFNLSGRLYFFIQFSIFGTSFVYFFSTYVGVHLFTDSSYLCGGLLRLAACAHSTIYIVRHIIFIANDARAEVNLGFRITGVYIPRTADRTRLTKTNTDTI